LFHDFSTTAPLAKFKNSIFQLFTNRKIAVSEDLLFRQNKISVNPFFSSVPAMSRQLFNVIKIQIICNDFTTPWFSIILDSPWKEAVLFESRSGAF